MSEEAVFVDRLGLFMEMLGGSRTDTYRMIGSSVTDPGWLDQIPTEAPTLVVAEGLLMYLTQ
jgi:O-methyltransferase involved in polyketide biosynthesis